MKKQTTWSDTYDMAQDRDNLDGVVQRVQQNPTNHKDSSHSSGEHNKRRGEVHVCVMHDVPFRWVNLNTQFARSIWVHPTGFDFRLCVCARSGVVAQKLNSSTTQRHHRDENREACVCVFLLPSKHHKPSTTAVLVSPNGPSQTGTPR